MLASINREFSLATILTVLSLALIPLIVSLIRIHGFNIIKLLLSNTVTTLIFVEDRAIGTMRGTKEPLIDGLLAWLETNVTNKPLRQRFIQFLNGKKFNTPLNDKAIWFKHNGVYGRYVIKHRTKGDFGTGPKIHELVLLTVNEKKVTEILEEIKPNTVNKNTVFDYKFSRVNPEWINVGKYQTKNELFLDKQTIEILETSLTRFKNNKAWYLDKGLPWKFTALLHGKSGSGKSSIITHIAKFLDCPIYRVNLETLPVGEMVSMIQSIPPGSILALEDFDDTGGIGKRATKENAEEKVKGKLTEFLNAFRGVVEINGIITILTTNHLELLDPAILSAGRIDRLLEIKEMDFEQFKQFYQYHYNDILDVNEADYVPRLASDISNAFVLYPEDKDQFKKLILEEQNHVSSKLPQENT